MNAKTLTPQRATDSLLQRFGTTTTEHRLKWRPWLTNPESVGNTAPFALRRTDIDLFEHVTNTAYWHAVDEVAALYPEICTPPYRAVIEYRKPIRYGEEVTLGWTQASDGEVQIALTVDGQVRAAAVLHAVTTLSRCPNLS